jgi:hypothetical protein
MTPQQFIAKWKPVALTERATAQSHFLDLCALLGHDDPVSADPTGEFVARMERSEIRERRSRIALRSARATELHEELGGHH